MTAPLSLGEVRAHIERKIREHQEDEQKLAEPAWRELRLSIKEKRLALTEVLSLLDRVPHLTDLEAIQKAARAWHDASLALGKAVAWRKPDDVLEKLKEKLEDSEAALFAIAGPALSGLDRVQSDGEIAERKSIMSKDVVEDEIVVRAEPQSSIRFVPPRREVLQLWPDGTSQYDSDDDLREAAAIFWQSGRPDESGAVEASFTPTDGKRPGFRIHRNGAIEYFDGYQPDNKTRHALETIASLRPVVSQEGEGQAAP